MSLTKKIKIILTLLSCAFKFLNYMSINQNNDIQHKIRVEKKIFQRTILYLESLLYIG